MGTAGNKERIKPYASLKKTSKDKERRPRDNFGKLPSTQRLKIREEVFQKRVDERAGTTEGDNPKTNTERISRPSSAKKKGGRSSAERDIWHGWERGITKGAITQMHVER